MKNITRILSAALALCLLAALCLPARAGGTQDCGAKLLAITFDDGPGKYTGALLDGLAERGVHATFFVNGVNASGWPETLKRIVNEGHQLANHTYNHKNLNTCSAQTVAYEISAVQALITAAGGDENAYIRAPYGNANKTVKSVVTAPLIYWSVDPEDWKYRNAETVRSNIEAGVFDGAIILVHDIYKTSVDGALAAIDDLLAEGYEFVTVQDLLLRRGVTPEAATVYYSAKNNGINLPADAVGEQAFDESRIETHWGYAAMKTCLDYGWMTLTDTGEWKPNAFVTRAEFAADLARFVGIHTLYPLEGAARFSDVDLTAEDAPYLAWAADSGIVAGYDDGTFRPKRPSHGSRWPSCWRGTMHAPASRRREVWTSRTLRKSPAGPSTAYRSAWDSALCRAICGAASCRRAGSPARRSPRSSCGWQDNKMGCPDVFGTALFSYSISMRCPSRSSSWRACRRSGRCRRDAPA